MPRCRPRPASASRSWGRRCCSPPSGRPRPSACSSCSAPRSTCSRSPPSAGARSRSLRNAAVLCAWAVPGSVAGVIVLRSLPAIALQIAVTLGVAGTLAARRLGRPPRPRAGVGGRPDQRRADHRHQHLRPAAAAASAGPRPAARARAGHADRLLPRARRDRRRRAVGQRHPRRAGRHAGRRARAGGGRRPPHRAAGASRICSRASATSRSSPACSWSRCSPASWACWRRGTFREPWPRRTVTGSPRWTRPSSRRKGPDSHMHVGAVMIFEGPPPAYEDFLDAHPLAAAPRAALPAEARVPAARDRAAAVGRRPELQPRLPRPPHRAAGARRRGAAARARRAHPLPAARPRASRCGRRGSSRGSRATASR